MKEKLELLLHIDAPTRKEVLRWCKDYEAEIQRLKKKQQEKIDYRQIYTVTGNVLAAIKKHGKCSVFYDGKFKVLSQPVRIENEESILVGTYDKNYIAKHLVEDIKCTLNDVTGMDVLIDMLA